MNKYLLGFIIMLGGIAIAAMLPLLGSLYSDLYQMINNNAQSLVICIMMICTLAFCAVVGTLIADKFQ